MDTETAHVLLVGSHPVLTAYGGNALTKAGWSTTSVVGPEAGLDAMAKARVDALVLGGPVALRAKDRLVAELRRHHPFALVVVPGAPDRIVDAVEAAFGEAQ